MIIGLALCCDGPHNSSWSRRTITSKVACISRRRKVQTRDWVRWAWEGGRAHIHIHLDPCPAKRKSTHIHLWPEALLPSTYSNWEISSNYLMQWQRQVQRQRQVLRADVRADVRQGLFHGRGDHERSPEVVKDSKG